MSKLNIIGGSIGKMLFRKVGSTLVYAGVSEDFIVPKGHILMSQLGAHTMLNDARRQARLPRVDGFGSELGFVIPAAVVKRHAWHQTAQSADEMNVLLADQKVRQHVSRSYLSSKAGKAKVRKYAALIAALES